MDDDYERPTSCYCTATNAPCSWCESWSRECEHCGSIVDQDDHCCGFYADGSPGPTPEEIASARARAEQRVMEMRTKNKPPMDWTALIRKGPPGHDPSEQWDNRRK